MTLVRGQRSSAISVNVAGGEAITGGTCERLSVVKNLNRSRNFVVRKRCCAKFLQQGCNMGALQPCLQVPVQTLQDLALQPQNH